MSAFRRNSAFGWDPQPLPSFRTPPPTRSDPSDGRHTAGQGVDERTLERWYRLLDDVAAENTAPTNRIGAARIPLEDIEKLIDLRDEIYSHLRG